MNLPDPVSKLGWHLDALAEDVRASIEQRESRGMESREAASSTPLREDSWRYWSLSSNDAARFMRAFCESSGTLPALYGRNLAGDMVRYVMGGGKQLWLDAAKADLTMARAAVDSVHRLYEDLFAVHLTAPCRKADDLDRLANACYMLWDMDGIQYAPTWRPELRDSCLAVLERALALDSPACWESALHGLGHYVLDLHPEPRPLALIDAFLARRGADLSDDLREYADAARTGYIH